MRVRLCVCMCDIGFEALLTQWFSQPANVLPNSVRSTLHAKSTYFHIHFFLLFFVSKLENKKAQTIINRVLRIWADWLIYQILLCARCVHWVTNSKCFCLVIAEKQKKKEKRCCLDIEKWLFMPSKSEYVRHIVSKIDRKA